MTSKKLRNGILVAAFAAVAVSAFGGGAAVASTQSSFAPQLDAAHVSCVVTQTIGNDANSSGRFGPSTLIDKLDFKLGVLIIEDLNNDVAGNAATVTLSAVPFNQLDPAEQQSIAKIGKTLSPQCPQFTPAPGP